MAEKLQLGIVITADGKSAEGELARVKANLDGVKRSSDDVRRATDLARNAFRSLAAAFSVRELIRTTDAYAGIQGRLKLISGGTSEFVAAQKELYSIAQQNLAPLAETVQLYSRLAPAMRELGQSQRATLTITDLVGKSMRISGTDAASAAAGILQFGQAIGSGVLRGDEFNSVMENSLRLAQALADGLKVPTSALRGMAEQGELTADKVIKALQSQAEVIRAEYKNIPLTVSGAWQQLQNALTVYIGRADQANGSSRKLAESIALIARNLESVLNPLATFVEKITTGWAKTLDSVTQVNRAFEYLKNFVEMNGKGWNIPTEQYKEEFGVNQAISREDWEARKRSSGEYFDGIRRGATDAALATTKLSDAQKAVASQIIETAKANKVDPAWALAIAEQESRFNQLAKSAKGALGVMQLMPGTAKELGVNFADLNDNIKGGVLYLKQQEERFKSLKLASAAYNAGPGAVQKYAGVPPYKETQEYVASVGALYEKWKAVLGAQNGAFSTAKEQADEMGTAFARLRTHQDAQAKAAEEYAKLQVGRIKTSLAALDAERQAAQDVTAAQLAGAKTLDDKQRVLASAAQQGEAYQQRALDLVRQEYAAQAGAIEARKAALQNELANADKYNVTIDEQFKLKQEIRSADNELAILAQSRAQAEIAAGQQVNDAARKSADLKRDERNAIADIIAEYERQVEVFDRLTRAKEDGATTYQLGLLGQYYGQSQQLPEIVTTEQLQRMSQYKLSTLAIRDATIELTAGMTKHKSIEQQVADEQLRLNAAFQNGVQQAQLFAKHATEAFGQAGEGIGKIAISVAQFFEQSWQVARDFTNEMKAAAELGDTGNLDRIKAEYEAIDKAATKSAQYQIGLYGDITSAAMGYFEESSKGYSALQNATKVFRAFEMAMALKSMITQIAGFAAVDQASTASMGVQVANDAVKGQSLATLNVINQGQGDPYSAWARMAAMAATMAALGFAVAGGISGGGGGTSTREALQKAQGTGSVLGDPAAQSESIAKSIEIVAENTSNDLNYSAKMLAALENIESALAGAASAIYQNVAPAIANAVASLGVGKSNPLAILGATTKSVTDAGIYVMTQSLEKALKGIQAAAYANVTSKNSFLGLTLSSRTDEYGRPLDQETATQFTRTLKGMRDALVAGGEAFGLTADDFTDRLKKFQIDIGKISLQDLSADEAQKAIAAAFGKVFDGMAAAFVPEIKRFQLVGEGMAETFFRVSSGMNEARGELAQFGIEALDFRAIKDKRAADIGGEIFKQSYAATNDLNDATKQWLMTLRGGAHDVADSVRTYEDAMRAMRTANLSTVGFDPATAGNRVGGLANLAEALQTYNEQFLSQSQQIAGASYDLAEAFLKLGVAVPASKDEFVALVESIDITKAGGNELRAALLALGGQFADTKDKIQAITGKYADILNPFGKIGAQIQTVGDDFNALIADAIAPIKATTDAKTAPWKDTLAQDEQDLAKYYDLQTKQIANIAKWTAELDEELGKKKPNKKHVQELKDWIAQANRSLDSYALLIPAITAEIKTLQQSIADEVAKGAIDEATASAKLAEQAGIVMTDTVGKIFEQLTQSIQAAQAKIQAAVDFQSQLQTQIASLQGPDATAALMRQRANEAQKALDAYILSVTGRIPGGGGLEGIAGFVNGRNTVKRNTEEELRLLGNLQQAVMDRYNAEVAMVQQLEQTMSGLAQSANNIRTQIAQLQGPGAVASLAQSRYAAVRGEVVGYYQGVSAGEPRDYNKELDLINRGQQAVMDKYNAEMALAQQAAQVQADAMNAALQSQIDAINASAEAQIDAINDQLDAALKARQKEFDAANKLTQKQFDAEIKAQQKVFDAANKATQKQFDAEQKTLQKSFDIEQKALRKKQDAELDALNEQLDAANKLRDAIKSVAEYAQSMLLGANSVLSPEQRLAEAQRQYQELRAKARGGDADAIAKLVAGSSDAYLEIAKQYYGSGSQYQSIFDGVRADMEGIGGMSAPDPDSIQSRIDALRESQEAGMGALQELQSEQMDLLREQQSERLDLIREQQSEQLDLLREQQSEQLDSIREAQQAQLEGMRDAANAQIKAVQDAAQAQIKAAQESTARAIADLVDPEKNSAMKALRDAAVRDLAYLATKADEAREGAAKDAEAAKLTLDGLREDTVRKLKEIADLAEKTRAEAERQAANAIAQAKEDAAKAFRYADDQLKALNNGIGFSKDQRDALNAIAAKMDPGFRPGGFVPAYAAGGYAQAGIALVGEKGPELVRFERPAQVLTSEQTRKALSGDDGKTYQALEAIKSELRAIVATQSNANPQLIERLASIEGRLNAMEREQKTANSQGGRRTRA